MQITTFAQLHTGRTNDTFGKTAMFVNDANKSDMAKEMNWDNHPERFHDTIRC